MTWRVHLANQAIQDIHIINGRDTVVAVWLRRDFVSFYDLETGALLGESHLPPAPLTPNRRGELWQEYLHSLMAPNGRTYLPVVRTAHATIHTSEDGRMRLFQMGDTELIFELEGKEVQLEARNVDRFVALELDRTLGMIAALDEEGKLHIYQQNVRVGSFEIGLIPQPDLRPLLAISQGSGTVFATDGRTIVQSDASGKVRRRLQVHYEIGRMACSPAGGMLVTSDMESGVIRVYNGADLMATHQRHAIDLTLMATQVQLFAELPPVSAALSALAAHTRGTLAFAYQGVICATSVEAMNELPRPQPLF